MMPVSKKTRFEVFKRDNFTCQYCGKTPPEAVLELDHIVPKSKGGIEREENYITACHDCNNGKGAKELTAISPPLETKIANLKEKRTQLKSYSEYLIELDKYHEMATNRLCKIYKDEYGRDIASYYFNLSTLRFFLRHIPLPQLEDAMTLACSKTNDHSEATRYFCGICWNRIKNPETRV